MLRRFPGRTLEELDQIDWPRYMRAVLVETIIGAEEKRLAFLGGRAASVSDAEWRIVAENENLLRKYNSG